MLIACAVPGFWIVKAISSAHDLDNIKLSSLSGADVARGVIAVYKLRNILVEGHARDVTEGQPPRGLQFVLGTRQDPNLVDTITMANFGYFQLQASPGVWTLTLRDGRSRELYDVLHVGENYKTLFRGGGDKPINLVKGAMVMVDGFDGLTLFVRVRIAMHMLCVGMLIFSM